MAGTESNNQPSLLASLIKDFAGVTITLLVAFGLSLTADQIAAIMGFLGFVGIALTLFLRARSVDKAKVVEQLLSSGSVVAGEANDIVPAGQLVREIGSESS